MTGYAIDTELVAADHTDQYHSANPPIYQTATFHQESLDNMGAYDYSRSGNPTRTAVERKLEKIMRGAHRAYAVSSGMGALDVVSRLLKPSDEVVTGSDLYGGTNRLLTYLTKTLDITVHFVDTRDPANVAAKLTARTRLVLLESPTNPAINICDVAAISKLVRAHKEAERALVVVDNTMMSPINMNPFELGADIWYESATKYLSGHHDLMAGALAVASPKLAEEVFFVVNATGVALAPFESWLLLRGLRTLSVRFEKQQSNAIAVAQFLESVGPRLRVPKFELLYPGLPSHPGYATHQRNARGPGAVLSFRTGDREASEKIVNAVRLYKISVSFGAVSSLISMPGKMSHASIDPKVRAERGFSEDLIRLCIGIENPADLIEDLRLALQKVALLD